MFCIKCGNKLKENMKFCDQCGAPVPASSTPRESFEESPIIDKKDSKEISQDTIDKKDPGDTLLETAKKIESEKSKKEEETSERQEVNQEDLKSMEIEKFSDIAEIEENKSIEDATENFPKLELHQEIIGDNFKEDEEKVKKDKEYFYESSHENKNYNNYVGSSSNEKSRIVNIIALTSMVIMGLFTIRSALTFISSFLFVLGGII